MALTEQAELVAKFSLQDNVSRPAMRIQGVMGRLNLQSAKLHAAFGKIGQGLKTGFTRGAILGAGALGLLVLNVKHGIESLAELEKIEKQTAVVLTNRGKTTALTTKAVRDLANAQEDLTTIDDKAVQAAANLILPYKQIGDKIFPGALTAAEDLSVALSTDLSTAARTVAKALADPAKGITRLTRLGVVFTAQEQDQIKALEAAGKTEEAQALILKKLSDMYGGSAAKAADTYQGSLNRLHDGVEELQKALASALLPALTKIANKMGTFLKDPTVVAKISQLGETIAGMFSDSNIEAGGKAIQNTFGALASLPWDQIKNGLQLSAAAAGKAVEIFKSLPPEVQGGLITLLAANKLTGGLVAGGLKDLVGLALGSLKTITAGNVTVIGGSVTGGGGGGTGVGGGVPGLVIAAITGAVVVKGIDDMKAIGDANTQLLTAGLTQDELNAIRLHEAVVAGGNASRGVATSANQNSAQLRANLDSGLAKLGLTESSSAADIRAAIDAAASVIVAPLNAIDGSIPKLIGHVEALHPLVPSLDRLRTTAMQAAHNGKETTAAVDHLTGIEKNRKTHITVQNTIRTSLNVSATQVAVAVERLVGYRGFVQS